MLAASNLQTEIATPKWYYAGDANKTCEVLEPEVLQRCEDGVFLSPKKILITCDPGRLVGYSTFVIALPPLTSRLLVEMEPYRRMCHFERYLAMPFTILT